jgi:hypothetical protein
MEFNSTENEAVGEKVALDGALSTPTYKWFWPWGRNWYGSRERSL